MNRETKVKRGEIGFFTLLKLTQCKVFTFFLQYTCGLLCCGAADKTEPEIVPFINPHDHRDGGGPFPPPGDDLDSDWDVELIDEMIDDDIDDELIH